MNIPDESNLFVISSAPAIAGDLSSGDFGSYSASRTNTSNKLMEDEKGIKTPLATPASSPTSTSLPKPNYTEIESHHSIRSLLSTDFWRYYCDIDSVVFFRRFFKSLQIPTSNLYRSIDESKPDIYGPFWMSTTLIFLSLIIGNVIRFAHYLMNLEDSSSWYFDFTILSKTTPVYYIFTFVVPFFLCFLTHLLHVFAFKNSATPNGNAAAAAAEEGRGGGSKNPPTLATATPTSYPTIFRLLFTIACVYGYCLSPLLFLLFLLLIPVLVFQWIILVVATLYSLIMTIVSLYPVMKLYYPLPWRYIAVLVLLLPHAALCISVGVLTL